MEKYKFSQTKERDEKSDNGDLKTSAQNTEILSMLSNTKSREEFENKNHTAQKNVKTCSKKFQFQKNNKVSNKILFNEFLNFTENFLILPTDKKYNEFFKEETENETKQYSQIYALLFDLIRDKLCAMYKLTKSELPGDFDFKSELVVDLNELSRLTYKNEEFKVRATENFFKNNQLIYEGLLPETIKNTIDYKCIRDKLRIMQNRIENVFEKRMFFKVYTKVYENIHKPLKEMYIKNIMKKKKKMDEFDEETIFEYLHRVKEFIEAFGEITQFKDEEMCFENILDDFDEFTDKYL
ncbi:hypothetical protein EHP00_91 [Ecytonucleospora hepatopenaei]|uniref:Uncharacterized protein n=1 Tax=Ecytonucleospora hepatopenaei TaxID=646526 RepID=A0A1W0E5V0_9MICR|nr:hypothetical protein EHP00_91 [Ecytonucleospora hepatopenaei]